MGVLVGLLVGSGRARARPSIEGCWQRRTVPPEDWSQAGHVPGPPLKVTL